MEVRFLEESLAHSKSMVLALVLREDGGWEDHYSSFLLLYYYYVEEIPA